jgi:septal ring factor EnvC (AmiA/AmiB activator)
MHFRVCTRSIFSELRQTVLENYSVDDVRSNCFCRRDLNDKMKEECASRDTTLNCTREALRQLRTAYNDVSEEASKTMRELANVKAENENLESDLKQTRCQLVENGAMKVQCYEQKMTIEVSIHA